MAEGGFDGGYSSLRSDHKRKFDGGYGGGGGGGESERRVSGFSSNPSGGDPERRVSGFSSTPNPSGGESERRVSGFSSNPGGSDSERRVTGFSSHPGGGDTERRVSGFSSNPSGGDSERRVTGFSSNPGGGGDTERRVSGFSSNPGGGGVVAAASGYNSVPPPLSDFERAKQRAQEIAARLVAAQDSGGKRGRADDGSDDAEDRPWSAGIASFASNDSGGGGGGGGYEGRNYQQPLQQQQRFEPNESHAENRDDGGQPGSYFNMRGGSGVPQSRRIEIPNAKVGLIIGKGGESIKYLQQRSGARIQITRDSEHDPSSTMRHVELMGTTEQINRAEQMIKEAIDEADAGGSGAVPSRVPNQAEEQVQMRVPNNKVGLIIGKGGETIKSLQSKTGARIQLAPLNPPSQAEVEAGTAERTLILIGSKQQTDAVTELINEVISENRFRTQMPGGVSQQQQSGYRSSGAPAWGPGANLPPPPQAPQQPYGYQQGPYSGPPQAQYPGESNQYGGGYMQQPPVSSFSSSWDHPPPGVQQQGGPYGYYNQPGKVPGEGNYAYSQPQEGGYNQYSQNYGHQSSSYENYDQPPPGNQPPYEQPSYTNQTYEQVDSNQPSFGQTAPPPPPYSGYGQGQQQPDSSQNSYGGNPPPYNYGQYGQHAPTNQAGYGQQGYGQEQSGQQQGYGVPSFKQEGSTEQKNDRENYSHHGAYSQSDYKYGFSQPQLADPQNDSPTTAPRNSS